MDFVTGLSISINWKRDNHNFILVILDWLIKMVHYKPVKITLDISGVAKVIIDVVVRYHGLLNLIITNRSLLLTLKFWSLLFYFLCIKRKLSTTFYPKTDSQTERQKSIIEAYLRTFVNFMQKDWAKFLPMAKFSYNNTKNPSISHMPFELNCGYYLCIFFKKDTNLYF